MVDLARPTYDTGAKRSLALAEVKDLWRYRNLVYHMVRTNVTSRYKRSVLGVAWTLMDPLLTMAVMAVIFEALFRRSIAAFPVFLLSGIIVWNFFAQATSSAMTDLMYSGGRLMGRVYLPKSVFAVAAVGTGVVNLLFSLLPLFAFVLLFARPVTLAWLFLPLALVVLSAFTLGIGLLVSSFAVFFADMVNIYGFLLRLVMYLSGIFYYLDSLPTPLQWVVRVNPAYHMIRLFRDPIYEGILPRWEIIAYSVLWAVVALSVGLWVFTRRANEFAYRI